MLKLLLICQYNFYADIFSNRVDSKEIHYIMIFHKILQSLQKKEDVTDTVIYRLAERIIKDAVEHGGRSIAIKCHPTNKSDIIDAIVSGTEHDSPIQTDRLEGRGNYELGFFVGKDAPYITLPVMYFLPLLHIFSSVKTEYKGKSCFAIYKGSSSQKEIERYIDLTVYLESDTSISIDVEEIM